ncbi:uncharacterized protein UV8b_00936 [Ustilaginoidea virens]|uniref:Phytase A n=1 Tax=Ustilaginoidea virens TaxID=1159556 RepID=A0A8E5HK30_USTVR|nr:uncharacterized protein UV8b_00936 [Ustilaginoidea virens]QUC16695.1 hypothetical protein UV8b_00936 [Ustilaginoidea virens]
MGSIRDAAASVRVLLTAGNHRYKAIPTPAMDRNRAAHVVGHHPPPRSRFLKLSMGVLLLAAFLFLGVPFRRDTSGSKSCVDNASCTYNSHKYWGQYSPYFVAPDPSRKPDIPAGCHITFASVLSRHGSRLPTAGKSHAYKKLVDRLHKDVQVYAKGFKFIKKYKYSLGADDLTAYGEGELVASGKRFFKRYRKLAEHSKLPPFVRASGSERVVMSAERFMQGYSRAKGRENDKDVANILVIPEGDGFNNTLDHGNCAAFEEGPISEMGNESKAAWRNVWAAPIAERLNRKLRGANLTLQETIQLMDLCPFNTVASAEAKTSQFCRLFSLEEWKGYDYYLALDKWYGYGPGNPLGPTQGVGYVNELIARLAHSPVSDHTSTNRTLDSDASTFPLDRALYADFSHDNTLMTIYGALGLYTNATEVPTNRRVPPQKTDGYSASWAVPFGARMYVEKMRCDGVAEELVRVLVNDRLVTPKGCQADALGRCKLEGFLEGLEFAKQGGHWDQCGRASKRGSLRT